MATTWGPNQVAAGKDDALEYGGGAFNWILTVGYVFSDVAPGGDNYRTGGLRWQNVTVPKDATITSATLSFYVNWAALDDANFKIYGHLVADAPNFEDNQNIISVVQRPRTTDFEPWVEDAIAAGGAGWYDAPDIKDVIQELVNQGAWASGNDLVLLLLGNTDGHKEFAYYNYEQAPAGDWGVKLTIVYEEAAPPSAKTLVQAALISAIPLIAIPTLAEIVKFTGSRM